MVFFSSRKKTVDYILDADLFLFIIIFPILLGMARGGEVFMILSRAENMTSASATERLVLLEKAGAAKSVASFSCHLMCRVCTYLQGDVQYSDHDY